MKRFNIMTFLAVIAALSGCNTDIETKSTHRTPIVPVVVPDIETKTAGPEASLVQVASYPFGELPLSLNVYEGDMSAPATRGTALTTESLTAFKMTAYANGQWYDSTIPAGQQGSESRPNQAGLYFEGANVTKDGDEWVMDPEQYWLNGINGDLSIRFWSWAGSAAPETSISSLFHEASFKNYTVAANVQSQEDLIYAYNAETRKIDSDGNILDGKDEYVKIHFYHALSEIRFDVSGVAGDLYVSDISLKNVYGKGACSMKETDGADGTRLYFTWSNLSTPTTYSQAFTESDFDSDGHMVTDTDKKMYLIPQELTDDVMISVTFSPKGGGSAGAITKSISMNGANRVEWKAGKYYTYKLKYTGGDQLTLELLALPWDYYEPAVKYDEEVEVTSALQFDSTTCTVDETNHKVYFKGSNPITGSFKLNLPAEVIWSISKEGDYDAFEIDNTATGTYGDGEDSSYGTVDAGEGNSFTLYPKDVATGRDYSIQLSFSVRYPNRESYCIDDKVQIDSAAQPVRWTIILSK